MYLNTTKRYVILKRSPLSLAFSPILAFNPAFLQSAAVLGTTMAALSRLTFGLLACEW